MAADKTLVAGAASIAQAQYELDTATTTGLQRFGKDMIDWMAQKEQSIDEIKKQIAQEWTEVNEISEGAVDDMEEGTGADEIKNKNLRREAKNETSKLSDNIMQQWGVTPNAQSIESYTNSSEFLDLSDKVWDRASFLAGFDHSIESSKVSADKIDDLNYFRSFMSDINSPLGQLAKKVIKGDFQLSDPPKDWADYNNPYAVIVDGKEYKYGRVKTALKQLNSLANPTISLKVESDIERDFRSAKNDDQANQISNNIIKSTNSVNKLETFMSHVQAENIGVIRKLAEKAGVFDYKTGFNDDGSVKETEEYKKYLEGLRNDYIVEMKKAYYNPPAAPEVDEPSQSEIDREDQLRLFNAQKSYIDKLNMGMGTRMMNPGGGLFKWAQSKDFAKQIKNIPNTNFSVAVTPPEEEGGETLIGIYDGERLRIRIDKDTSLNELRGDLKTILPLSSRLAAGSEDWSSYINN